MAPAVTIPRKKSCNSCFKSKLRCDLRRPSCTRCQNRKWNCIYPSGAKPSGDETGIKEIATLSTVSLPAPENTQLGSDPKPVITQSLSGFDEQNGDYTKPLYDSRLGLPIDVLNFSAVQLLCTVDAHRIRVRWLESLLPSIDQRPKPYDAATMAFAASIFKSYPGMFVNGERPPFIHWSQVTGAITQPLANCANIARMWTARTAGSADMVREVIEQEMLKIYEKRAFYDHLELLAAFQAYLLYAIMLFFSDTSAAGSIEQDVVMNLQGLAGDVAGKGTLCFAEIEGTRPDWESWIVASAKRRTLFATTLFDNLVNFTQGSPSFAAVELASLPAPATKVLWTAQTRQSWNQAYNRQLGHSNDGELLISDLWPQTEANLEVLQPKIDRWLSSVDEFGMMVYAVTAHTYHRSPHA